ncbi:MAG: hypothetical protein E7263_08360 [Lachnospiraceae bacterium]|nr:hypothetical protein [Lachnospiraceae bacterium]
MGSGLSMTSVNKIKELATAREYSLALEIIDSQDLTKSLNPQFVRLCGDVYIANKRYKDARKVLLMAHKMAPEAKRVIYSLVDLYLRMGYKELADFYYRLYMYDAEPGLPQTIQMNYIYDKAQGCPLKEIETLLFPMYSDVMDYDWSYELYLLMKMQGKEDDAQAIKADYLATYKSEPNVLLIEGLEQSNYRLDELFYIYSKDEVADDSPEEEELRQEERILMDADELRMNPKEAEIQIVFDSSEKTTFGEKLKYKKHMKEQVKLAKKAGKDGVEETEESSSETAPDALNTSVEAQDASSEEKQGEELLESKEEKVNIFKKIFSKKKNDNVEDVVSEETDNIVEAESSKEQIVEEQLQKEQILEEQTQEEQVQEKLLDDVRDVEYTVDVDNTKESVSEAQVIEELVEEVEYNSEDVAEEVDNVVENVVEQYEQLENEMESLCDISDEIKEEDFDFEKEKMEVPSDSLSEVEVDTATEDESDEESIDDMGDSQMQEIYGKKKISIVSELGEDTFVNTQEFSQDSESSNPFEEMFSRNKKTEYEEVKTSFVVEEVQLQPEDDDYDVDDFTEDFSSLTFDDVSDKQIDLSQGEIKEEADKDDVNEGIAGSVVDDTYINISEPDGLKAENSVELEEELADISDVVVVDDQDSVWGSGVEDYHTDIWESAEEDEHGDVWDSTEEKNPADISERAKEDEQSEVWDSATTESVSESTVEETVEQIDDIFETISEEVLFDDPVSQVQEQESNTDFISYNEVIEKSEVKDVLGDESVYNANKDKLDFPEFKSSLFPEIGQEVAEVQNNFDEIMSVGRDKINENLLKEEQMQREAEALLASLGIDLGDVKTISKLGETTSEIKSHNEITYATSTVDERNTQDVAETQYNDVTQETVDNYSPSRDELKSSLKIDSVKKNILRQIKEYR